MSPGSKHTPLRVAFRRPWPGTRRGFKLWLFALVIGLRGLLYAIDPSTSSAALQFPVDWLNTQRWGVLVVLTCLGAVWSSYCHFGRDRYGYTAMTFLAVMWAFIYAYGYTFQGASNAAAQGALSFILIAVVMIHCSGDPEMPDLRRHS